MRIDRKIIDDLNTKTHPKEKAKFQPITVEGQTPFYTPDTTQKTPIEAPKTPEKTESAQTGTGTMGMPTYTKKDHTSYMYDATTDKAYTEALAALQAARANMPTYKNSYDADIEAIYNEIVGREDFRYDINEDALYHQYADQYQRLGKLAMMDTMGQAAIMTGGYGNSYANTAGNQAYQLYLGELNKVVPELYGMAHDRYTAEGEEMLDQYGMLLDRADDEYSKYLAELDQYWKNVSYLGGEADKAYDRGRENFYAAQELAAAEAEREAEFNAYYQQLLANSKSEGTDVDSSRDNDPTEENGYFGSIRDTAANIENEGELDDFLTEQYEAGRLTEEEVAEIYEEYDLTHPDPQKPVADRDYTMTDDGGVNWFWGIDRNAKVKDHYDNEFTMAELYDELKKTMTNKEAKEYVKALQKELGITK